MGEHMVSEAPSSPTKALRTAEPELFNFLHQISLEKCRAQPLISARSSRVLHHSEHSSRKTVTGASSGGSLGIRPASGSSLASLASAVGKYKLLHKHAYTASIYKYGILKIY